MEDVSSTQPFSIHDCLNFYIFEQLFVDFPMESLLDWFLSALEMTALTRIILEFTRELPL